MRVMSISNCKINTQLLTSKTSIMQIYTHKDEISGITGLFIYSNTKSNIL
jgi:hypothetical protein